MNTFPSGNAVRAGARLGLAVVLLALATWPSWAVVLVLRSALAVLGAWWACVALGALLAMACNAEEEKHERS